MLDDVEMGTPKFNRETECARARLVNVFPRAGELAEVRAKRDRLSAELAADGAAKAAGKHATKHDPARATNGVQPSTPTSHPGQAGQASQTGHPAIAPPPSTP